MIVAKVDWTIIPFLLRFYITPWFTIQTTRITAIIMVCSERFIAMTLVPFVIPPFTFKSKRSYILFSCISLQCVLTTVSYLKMVSWSKMIKFWSKISYLEYLYIRYLTDLRAFRLPAFIFSRCWNKPFKLILLAHNAMWFSIKIQTSNNFQKHQ